MTKGIKLAAIAGLAFGVPSVALAQEVDSCRPQTVAQLLGIEEIEGCSGGTADATGPVTGLQTAHESSGGNSTSALEHANSMSGGAVLAALSGNGGGDDDDDDGDSGGRPESANGGRPDNAGGGRPSSAGRP